MKEAHTIADSTPRRTLTCVACGQPIPTPTSDAFRCPACRTGHTDVRDVLQDIGTVVKQIAAQPLPTHDFVTVTIRVPHQSRNTWQLLQVLEDYVLPLGGSVTTITTQADPESAVDRATDAETLRAEQESLF